MIKLLIFDLDNTLFDTYGQIGKNVLDEMIYRMRKAGLEKEHEAILRKKYHFTGFRILARELNLSDKLVKIGMSVYEEMNISSIKPYDDIRVLGKLEQKKAIVTSGTKQVQMNKVKILGIQHYFDDIVVDESISLEGRRNIFSSLAKQYKAKPNEVMVIGDNPEVELVAGKSLGMITVHLTRRPNALQGEADYHVSNLYKVEEIIKNIKS